MRKTMNTTAKNYHVRFDANVDGVPTTLTFPEAHELLYTLSIGWILRSGLYRYAVEGYEDQLNLYDTKLTAPALHFGRTLHE